MKLIRTDNPIDRKGRIAINQNWGTLENDFNNVVSIVSESAAEQVIDAARLIWQTPVDDFNDIATTYPTPEEGWAVQTLDDGKVYRYEGGSWVWKQQIDAGPVNALDTRLSNEIAQITVPLRKYYVDDFTSALNAAIADGQTYINIDGYFDIKTPGVYTLPFLNLEGTANIKVTEDQDSFLKFEDCGTVTLGSLVVDCDDNQVYNFLDFDDCEFVNVKSASFRNAKNTDENKETEFVTFYCKYFNIDNFFIGDTQQVINPANIGSGLGALRGIGCYIDENHKNGFIGNVNSNETHNIDASSNIIEGDCDTVVTFYKTGLTPANLNIKANIVIGTINGNNFGKRLGKFQTNGVKVGAINGYTNYNDTFSAVGMFCPDIEIGSVDLSSSTRSTDAVIELSNSFRNINIENIIATGSFNNIFNVAASTSFDAYNVKFGNVVLNNVQCDRFLGIYRSVKNLEFGKVSGKITCDGPGFITNAGGSVIEVRFGELNLDVTGYSLLAFNASSVTNKVIEFLGGSIDFKPIDNTVTRVIQAPYGSNGTFRFNNTKLNVNNSPYLYGFIRLVGFDIVEINNSSFIGGSSGAEYFDISTKKMSIINLDAKNSKLIPKISEFISVDGLRSQQIEVINTSSTNIDCNCNNFTGVLLYNKSTTIVNSNIIYTDRRTVAISNGEAFFTVNYPVYMPGVRIVNSYAIGNLNVRVTPQNLNSFNNGTFIAKHSNTEYSGNVEVVVMYTY